MTDPARSAHSKQRSIAAGLSRFSDYSLTCGLHTFLAFLAFFAFAGERTLENQCLLSMPSSAICCQVSTNHRHTLEEESIPSLPGRLRTPGAE